MLSRGKGILFAVLLGAVCPALIISFLHQRQAKKLEEIQESQVTMPSEGQKTQNQLNVLMADGNIEAMSVQEYLACVILQEMPASFEIEALKAQAVVARTYALRRLELGGKHQGATVCTDSDCCQGYCDINEFLENGGAQESADKIRSAVAMTDNLVLIYNGDLIDATYFSCSGGMTEDAKSVWGADVPYLQATISPGEEGATHFVDTVTFTTDEFAKILNLEINQSPESWIGKITYTSGGGVDTIQICGKQFKGTEFRKMLNLRSTAFLISVVGNTVTVTTKGFGHRVGMSQYGADAMAVKGATFPDILAHYYSGTQLMTYKWN